MKCKIFIKTIFLSSVLTFSCTRVSQEQLYSTTGFFMDTYVEIKFYSTEKVDSKEMFTKVFNEISRIENKFSLYKPESEITKLNTYNEIITDEETYKLISDAIFISSITNGAFDVSILPLVKLWNIKSSPHRIPSGKEINSVRKNVDYKKIKIIPLSNGKYKIQLLPPLKGIDLGGIAKGYAVSSAGKILNLSGIKTYLINIGGDIYCHGERVWKIGVQHPRKPFGEVLTVLNLKNTSVCTSGDYERYFIKDGKRYHHIINPFTGKPEENTVSVTIITQNPVFADALSTGIFVLGYNHQLLTKLQKEIYFDYIIIDKNLTINSSLKIRQTHL